MSAGLLLGVRREHAIDATAAAATALGSQGDRAAAAAPNRSTRDEKLKVARRHPPRKGGRQLPPGGPAQPGATGLARTHRPRGRRPARSSDCRRACCALARSNSDQLGPIRRGAGPSPELRNTVAIVVAETLIPSFSSSPWIRT